MASSSSTTSSSALLTAEAYGGRRTGHRRVCLAQTFSRPGANPPLHRVGWVKSLLAVLTVILLTAACSSGSGSGSGKRVAAPAPTTTGISSTTSTAVVASTCAPSPSAGKASGGGDVAPPGDIPDNQAYIGFVSASGRYSVKVPEGWARTDAGPVTSFTDKLNTIRIEVMPMENQPTAASAQAQDVPAVQ